MTIHLWQAFLIGVIYYFGQMGTPWISLAGTHTVMRPLVNGALVGLVLGDPVKGTIYGAAIQLPFLAWIGAGGSVPMDTALAGTLGTALGMASGVSPSVAITLAVPISLIGTLVWILHMTVDITFVHMADNEAKKGNLGRINFLHVWPPQITMFIFSVVPAMLASYFGAGPVKAVISGLSGTPLHVLTVIGGLLPAIGIAMNLQAMTAKGTLVFFLLGFMIAVYSKMAILPIAIFAAIIAYVYTKFVVGQKGGAR
ncbi:PTS N-acetylgalactosamine transporter subunit IID [Ligilactobacillus salivarius]|uniref:PTS sugar transporter subunit IIC n=1 Tax=Ligilactobacillus salivarius TaxID=1624 RepID=UPI000A2DD1B2|nr:PTS sugar transporter subunit IIC [Ligilactobacillus salivarius]MBN2918862.1 PTS sugar transporter subunit IIC [Lactobacillus sp.]MYU93865.1 PTS sugar transporter subunit IIC [Ligilactobacillus salivarius]OTF88986.1 PTS N-acetylgalactosamine transporter subunit IID [Ligilactobacillus salivarius]PAY32993.1 PTS N-acetylgalactosamine transporter subunit IID [Ligilactobacillus salivarius]PAY43889.1 PTS N-acetylgalactosamine transporter subunit IID [Ligilactobacillus salivarius]